MCEVACGPLGVGGVIVPTCNGAEDDLWPQGGRLLLELFAVRKAILFGEVGPSFARGLYAEGGGGVGLKECDVDDDTNANVPVAALEAAGTEIQ
jgi:hypothetical protein